MEERMSVTTINLKLKHYKFAAEQNISMSALCRKALDEYIERNI